MRDFYLWFYIKNIGLPFIALLCALTEKDSRTRRICRRRLCDFYRGGAGTFSAQ